MGTADAVGLCIRSDGRIQWAVENCRVDDDGRYVAQAIQDGTAIAVSDGSFKDATGAAAFVLEGPKYAHHVSTGKRLEWRVRHYRWARRHGFRSLPVVTAQS